MKFSNWELYIIGESRLAVPFQFGKQSYVMFVSFENSRYQIEEVYHTGVGTCMNCYRHSDEKNPSTCFTFLLSTKDVLALDKEAEAYINQNLALKETPLTLKRTRGEQAKTYIKRMNTLLTISVRLHDGILFYAPDFTYYVALRERMTYRIDLTGNVSSYSKEGTVSPLIIARELLSYMKQNQSKNIGHLEAEVIFKYDMIGKKEAKLPLIIDSLKKSIQLFEEVSEAHQSESFQQLIAFLNEVLYREISLEYHNQEEFLALHERISSEIYAYATDAITYEECVDRILDNPATELDNRKDRVIFAIKAIHLMESVFMTLQLDYTAKAYVWFQAVYHKMFNYLRLELNITYETDLTIRQEKDEFLQHSLKQFFLGELEEVDTYELIDQHLPYIHLTAFEKINHLLQRTSRGLEGHVYYMMEIPFHESLEESLRVHVAYLGIDHIKAELIRFDENGEQEMLIKWLSESVMELNGLLSEFLVDELAKSWRISISPLRSNELEMTEYILFDGDRLFRLHFRKNT